MKQLTAEDFAHIKLNGLGCLAKIGASFLFSAIKQVIDSIEKPELQPLKQLLTTLTDTTQGVVNILTDNNKENVRQLIAYFEEHGEEIGREIVEAVTALIKKD